MKPGANEETSPEGDEEDGVGGVGWMVDLEISLAKGLGWSLYEMDRTDIGSLIPFVMRFTKTEEKGEDGKKTRKVYCDQVNL